MYGGVYDMCMGGMIYASAGLCLELLRIGKLALFPGVVAIARVRTIHRAGTAIRTTCRVGTAVRSICRVGSTVRARI